MSKPVEFLFDFGSPNAYLAHRVLPALAARTGATIEYRPCLLGGIFKATGNRSPMESFAGVRNKLEYEQLEMRRFVARHHLDAFRMNPHFPVNTLLMMRGAVVAREQGGFETYVETCFSGMWERGLKLDEPGILQQALEAAGLDGQSLLAGTAEPWAKQRLIDDTAAAVERGCFGLPTFFVGSEMFFGKDRLGEVEALLAGAG
jgi:2-hydroxychromene-2-carboxylate isomerase